LSYKCNTVHYDGVIHNIIGPF